MRGLAGGGADGGSGAAVLQRLSQQAAVLQRLSQQAAPVPPSSRPPLLSLHVPLHTPCLMQWLDFCPRLFRPLNSTLNPACPIPPPCSLSLSYPAFSPHHHCPGPQQQRQRESKPVVLIKLSELFVVNYDLIQFSEVREASRKGGQREAAAVRHKV